MMPPLEKNERTNREGAKSTKTFCGREDALRGQNDSSRSSFLRGENLLAQKMIICCTDILQRAERTRQWNMLESLP
jgi:hypothetical protein